MKQTRHRWQSVIGHIRQFVASVIFSVTDFCIQRSRIQKFLQKSGTAAPALQHTRLTKHILIFVRKSWNIYWSNHASWIEITHHFSKFLNSFHSWHLDGQNAQLGWMHGWIKSKREPVRSSQEPIDVTPTISIYANFFVLDIESWVLALWDI